MEKLLDMIMMALSIFLIISAIDISTKKVLTKLKRTQSELKRLATTDSLTGLFNRRFFEDLAETEIKRSFRYKKPLTLLMLDLDFFKKINDSCGHKAGDHVLEEVSTIFQASIRDIDLLGRYGGEEFIMLFPESDQKTSIIAAERIRKNIENTNLSFNNKILTITVSIGISTLSNYSTESLDTLIQHADKALYKSKGTGRNRITIWNEKL